MFAHARYARRSMQLVEGVNRLPKVSMRSMTSMAMVGPIFLLKLGLSESLAETRNGPSKIRRNSKHFVQGDAQRASNGIERISCA
jgi:hypothetical protein